MTETKNRRRSCVVVGLLVTGAIVIVYPIRIDVVGQVQVSKSAPQTKSFVEPRTAWGEPDLQGKWSYATITPLERPSEYRDKATLTTEEVAALNEDARTSADRRDGTAEADLERAYN